ncbi:TetR/AcrR family transcriptional regulator [Actinotignum sp. GS-2025g]|uniref:TetR/AcrR family transcriptional regulator n=1 Tax=Actinotignum TaxID=1653174 RepID=UPI002A82730F|nr:MULTISPECIES: TetR/AcrR family transcriptional regulator [Actinotignum]MDY5126863.1 TetR/AcrR family transcriptional regulator [Actinotignum sp. SLA_B059]MDY5150438.1 TetR/AcrR family transcriptional regulator [Actinotignum timonense]
MKQTSPEGTNGIDAARAANNTLTHPTQNTAATTAAASPNTSTPATTPATTPAPASEKKRVRMSRADRRKQLVGVARELFAAQGFDGVSIEEIAAAAQVSKPVVYEHFGSKEGIYNVVVDRELVTLTELLSARMNIGLPEREVLESIVVAVLDYIEHNDDGFRLLVQRSPATLGGDSFSTVIADVADYASDLLAPMLGRNGISPQYARIYGQTLAGALGQVGQWWVDVRQPDKETVAEHVVNFMWNGLRGLESQPRLLTRGGH